MAESMRDVPVEAGGDEVHLVIPAEPQFVRLARLTATGIASRMGFTFDAVEDLRLAIDELCFTLVGKEGRPGALRLRFGVLQDAIEITAEIEVLGGGAPQLTDWSDQILKALVDGHGITSGGETATFRLLKRRVVG